MEWLGVVLLVVFLFGMGIVARDAIKHAKKTITPNRLRHDRDSEVPPGRQHLLQVQDIARRYLSVQKPVLLLTILPLPILTHREQVNIENQATSI